MKYLVTAGSGPAIFSETEMVDILENIILPSFDIFLKLESEGKILGGGLPIGERAFVFIIEADSNEALDRILRNIPAWPVLEWTVSPLQSFKGRATQDRELMQKMKSRSS